MMKNTKLQIIVRWYFLIILGMNKKIKIIIGGVIAIIAIAIGTYTISPLFINTTVD